MVSLKILAIINITVLGGMLYPKIICDRNVTYKFVSSNLFI